MKLLCVFCLFFVCLDFGLVNGLKVSQKGVCVSKYTVTKTRPKTILVPTGKWCGTKKCTVKQTRKQKYTVITNQLMCCKGYVYTSGTDSCAPVCSTGCANGTCVDPETCHCAPPSYLDPNTRNKCLLPKCDHVCVNGFCSVNNTCVCNENYTSFNATHCAVNCEDGFEIDNSLNCVRKCEPPLYRHKDKCLTSICDHSCANGFCSVNNTCVCKDGYTAINVTHCVESVTVCEHGYKLIKNKCEPVCEPPCVNGQCAAPNVCECEKTFVKKNAQMCQEKKYGCGECRADGTCLIPGTRPGDEDHLMCCPQYIWDDEADVCVPDCEHGCVNGICIKPNQCVCAPPMILHNSSTPNTCKLPVCDQSCTNGNCTADNQCTCYKGHKPIDLHTCVPHCTNCSNGDCVSPNVCKCHKGYTKIDGQCKPQCKSDCRNGYCSEPDKCTCYHGYEPKGDKCEPVCEKSCQNGECIAPNTCECKLGYEPNNGHKEICIPKCSSGCSNGYCLEPEKCACNHGYELKDNVCQPVCKKSCQNGNCIAPNKCECKEGFEPKNGHNEICIPKCNSGCSNGYCTEPNKCTCKEGYEPKNGNTETCIPKCSSDCKHGYCSEPGKCSCNDGYALKDGNCQPVCKKPCKNGFCVGPNTCECNKGYEPKNGHKETCIPKCSNDCTNGYCSEPNKCTCKEGYKLNGNKCEPVCKEPCHNGNCVAPNTCKCLKGFEKSKEICLPKCDLCNNGVCIAPNECECSKGYTHTDKGCVPICEKSCVNGYCSGPNECSCNSGFTQDALDSFVCNNNCGPDMDLINGTCVSSLPSSPEMSSRNTTTTGIASIQLGWMVGGAVLLLLVVLVLVVISRLYARKSPQKTPDDGTTQSHLGPYGSVAYTVPNTLFRKDIVEEEEETNETLLEGTSAV
ncbi:fibrillin-1-like isoform X1 [Leguminivora glycinivorella]|uniref:fibrillin-1-like isoform X1 n=1 Tax=Leguminivora glycinivorella TaxID=1035111 RepID=UPI00200FB2B4|nr:fibrillin-1-like isoform X1 [Leguminivora glycinivorella]